MRHWPASRPLCSTVSGLSLTQQLGRLLVSVARSILQMLSPVSTGFERPSAQVQTGSLRIPSSAPQYLSGQLWYIADLPSRHRGRLCSLTSSLLDVLLSRLVTIGDRLFAAAGPQFWNSLPVDLLYRSQHFVRNWKHIYSGDHTQTLFLTASP